MKNRFVPNIIQGAIRPIEQLVTEDVPGIRENLGARHMILPKDIVTDAARSGAHIFRTQREVSRTDSDSSTPHDVSTSIATARLTLQNPNFIGTSDSQTRTGNQYITSPWRSIILQKGSNANPLEAPINKFSAVHGHPTPISSKLIGPKKVSGEIADVYAHENMHCASNSIVSESQDFMDLGLSPANTTDTLSPSSSPLP